MQHTNYYEVEASDQAKLGRALGAKFGYKIRKYIVDLDEMDEFAWLRARILLEQTDRYFPEYVAELHAYADAAGVNLLDLWAVVIEDDLSAETFERCTTVVTNEGRLIAHNEDWDPDASTEICILKKRAGSTTSLELYYYGCPLGGVAFSISSQGYIHCVNSIAHMDTQNGVPKHVIARSLSNLEFGDTDLERLLATPRSSGFAHTLIDRTAKLTSIECTATQHTVTKPETPYIHTNHLLDPGLAHLRVFAGGGSSVQRFEDAVAMTSPTMDATSMMRLLGDQSRGKLKSVFNRDTIARVIVDFDERTAYFWLKQEREKGWVAYSIDFLFNHGA